MEKSWKSHGISLRHSCGNPVYTKLKEIQINKVIGISNRRVIGSVNFLCRNAVSRNFDFKILILTSSDFEVLTMTEIYPIYRTGLSNI